MTAARTPRCIDTTLQFHPAPALSIYQFGSDMAYTQAGQT